MQKNNWSFKSPTSLVFGDNVSLELGTNLVNLYINKALLVTDEMRKTIIIRIFIRDF